MTVTNDAKDENEAEDASSRPTMGIQLPHLSEELEKRVERQISEYESTAGEGIIPTISGRDYFIEGCIGVLLTLYLVIEVFVV